MKQDLRLEVKIMATARIGLFHVEMVSPTTL
jgi:hypothetical protein